MRSSWLNDGVGILSRFGPARFLVRYDLGFAAALEACYGVTVIVVNFVVAFAAAHGVTTFGVIGATVIVGDVDAVFAAGQRPDTRTDKDQPIAGKGIGIRDRGVSYGVCASEAARVLVVVVTAPPD